MKRVMANEAWSRPLTADVSGMGFLLCMVADNPALLGAHVLRRARWCSISASGGIFVCTYVMYP